jgi:hypothetical protein
MKPTKPTKPTKPLSTLGRIRRWIARWWRDSGALDERLDAAKHDPARSEDQELERIELNGRFPPDIG